MTDEEPEVIDATYTEVKNEPQKKKPEGLLNRFAAYIAKNQADNRRAGVKPLSEELGSAGSNWMSGIAKGMASVGDEFEAELTGRKKKGQVSEDTRRDAPRPRRGSAVSRKDEYDEEEGEYFVEKLCGFLRYVDEDDDVTLWQRRGKQFTKVDHIYLGKLLTRYFGHKVVVKERDLMIK